MTSFVVLFLLVAVASFNVDGRVIKHQRQNADDNDQACNFSLMQCMTRFGSTYSDGDLIDTLLEDGLEEICPPFVNVKSCFEAALRSCSDNHPHRQTVKAIVEIIRFTCEEEVRVLNANRECLFGPETVAALNTQCPTHGLGHMCTLLADNECAFQVISTRCDNQSLADKLKNFVKKIQREAGCRTARSVRQLLDEYIQI
jgi:hypothetical protein